MEIIEPLARFCSLLYGTIIILTLYTCKLSKEILSLSRKDNISTNYISNYPFPGFEPGVLYRY